MCKNLLPKALFLILMVLLSTFFKLTVSSLIHQKTNFQNQLNNNNHSHYSRTLHNWPSFKRAEVETLKKLDNQIVIVSSTTIEIQAPGIGESCVGIIFKESTELRNDFRGENSQFTRLVILRCQIWEVLLYCPN